MTQYTTTTTVDVTNNGETWSIEAEVIFRLYGGCAPWQGGLYSCPSDADWYGVVPEVVVEKVEVLDVVERVGGRWVGVDLDGWELEAIERHVMDNVNDDDLLESLEDDRDGWE